MTTPRSDSETLGEYRLRTLEDQQRELVKVVQSSTADLGGKITALSTQIGTSLAALPDTYSPRLEAKERHQAIGERFEDIDRGVKLRAEAYLQRFASLDERIKENRARIERIEQAGWAFAVGMLMLLLGTIFAIFRTMGGAGS